MKSPKGFFYSLWKIYDIMLVSFRITNERQDEGCNMSKFDVICIGQVVQDILITNIPYNAFTSETDTWLAKEVTLTTGGDAANEASTLAKLGTKVALAVRVDNTNVGDAVFSTLQADGIDTSLIKRPEDCVTISSVVIIHPDGHHHFFVGPGKNCTPELDDFSPEMFEGVKAITVGSLFGLGKLDTDGIDQVFKMAQDAGVLTFADMTYDLDGIGPHGFDKIYPFTDYIMPSIDEAMYVTGKKNPDEIADYFLAAGVKNVMIKLGGEGCFFKNATERFYMDPFKVTPIDTTGCGDNFTAGFVHARVKGLSHYECAKFASAAGALNTQGVGAHMVIKSEQQVLDFIETAETVAFNRE